FFFSSRRRHTRFSRDWSSDVCSSDLGGQGGLPSGMAGSGRQCRGAAGGAGSRSGRRRLRSAAAPLARGVRRPRLSGADPAAAPQIGRASCRERGGSGGGGGGTKKTLR